MQYGIPDPWCRNRGRWGRVDVTESGSGHVVVCFSQTRSPSLDQIKTSCNSEDSYRNHRKGGGGERNGTPQKTRSRGEEQLFGSGPHTRPPSSKRNPQFQGLFRRPPSVMCGRRPVEYLFYYEQQIKWELKGIHICGCRCNERLTMWVSVHWKTFLEIPCQRS